MSNSKSTQIFVAAILCLVIFMLTKTVLQIPDWVQNSGMPIYPSILLTQSAIAGTVISAYGIYILIFSPILAKRRLVNSFNNKNPNPWELNEQWRRGTISHTNFGKLFFLWIFVLNWWGVIAFFAVTSWKELMGEAIMVKLLCLLFVLIGFVMLRAALLTTFHWFRFGKSFLLLETIPGRIGENFMAKIWINCDEKPSRSVELSIIAIERFWETNIDATDGYKRRSDVRDSEPIYFKTHKISPTKLSVVDGQLAVPVDFDIPEGALKTGATSAHSEIIWKISTKFTGKKDPKYQAEFEIPIF